MASLTKRKHSRRRLAALTFLSNISLDGTHKDTTLGVLNFNLHAVKPTDTQTVDVNKPVKSDVQNQPSTGRHRIERRQTISEGVQARKVQKWLNSEEKIESFCQVENGRSTTKNKDRVHKFVSETKARLSNLSQKRKQLIHQKSFVDSHGLPSCTSTESLAACTTWSRKASMTPSEFSCPSVLEVRMVKNIRDKHVHNERLVLLSAKKIPFFIYSLIPFQRHGVHASTRCDGKQEGVRRRHTSSLRQLSVINDGPDPLDLLALLGIEKPQEGQDISFGQFLLPTNLAKRCRSYAPEFDHPPILPHHLHPSGCMSFDQAITARTLPILLSTSPPIAAEKVALEREDPAALCHHPCHANSLIYNPNLLDDPELIAGKHSTLLAFPSYITSVINYVKPSDLKKDLNDKFKERFPHVHLTLSKLRSLKKEMHRIARQECNIDLLIVAQAFVYFEKLILKMLVNKQNRKLSAGACLLLSAKLNDVKGVDLRNLFEKIEAVFRVNRKDLINLEFGALVALEFSLHLSTWEILPHYQRLVYAS